MTNSEGILQRRVLADSFGVELEGVDGVSIDELARQVYDSLRSHRLVLLRFKRLSQRRHVELAAALGPVVGNDSRPAVRYEGGRDAHTSRWHSDLSWAAGGDAIGLLYCVRAEQGSDQTAFADMVSAERLLSDSLRERIDGRQGFHLTQAVASGHSLASDTPEVWFRRRVARLLSLVRPRDEIELRAPQAVPSPGAAHRLITRRGDESFLRLGHHVSTIDALDPVDTSALLEEVESEVIRPENVYVHTWRSGDLLLYDNTRLMHRRVEGAKPDANRLLRRFQVWVAGSSPAR